jgi:transcriptional regulator with XRE-family HTH domain
MPESFGVRLRQQREQQQIALATIAQQTKIKLSLLEELERDDVSHWPTGIFRRAYIRAYAHAIGLDQDVIVREFLELYPEPVEVVETDSAVQAGDVAAWRASPPIRLRYLVGSAIDSLWRLRRSVVERSSVANQDSAAMAPPQTRRDAVADPLSVRQPDRWPPAPPDLSRLARLCTEFSRLSDAGEAAPLLDEMAGMLDAVGAIVWVWDSDLSELRPALAHGYSDSVLAHLPKVRHDADNATAAAFRTAQTCVVRGSETGNAALVVPVIGPAGCAGALALELRQGSEERPAVRAMATIVAAQLSRLIEPSSGSTLAADRRLA